MVEPFALNCYFFRGCIKLLLVRIFQREWKYAEMSALSARQLIMIQFHGSFSEWTKQVQPPLKIQALHQGLWKDATCETSLGHGS